MSIESMVRMNQLYAYYHPLLTARQGEILSLYYEEDYSLAEIAEYYQVSRQAVHDTIKRSENVLEQYEANLKLLERRLQREAWLQEMEVSLDNPSRLQELINQMRAYDE